MLTLFLMGVAVAIIAKLLTYKPKYRVPIEQAPPTYRLYANGQEQDLTCPNCHRSW